MEKAVVVAKEEFGTIRTGRAHPSMFGKITAEYYGTQTPVNQLASFHIPEPRMVIVQPFDKSSMAAIEKAIRSSDLGVNPSNDGNVIRIVIPQLTEDRRREFAKLVKQRAEDARIAVRNIRRDEVDHLRKLEKEGHVSKDEIERNIATVQHITDSFIGKVDDLAQKKEAEILEV
jgi:ribosome recycling factor